MKLRLLLNITQEYIDNLNDPKVNRFLSIRGKKQTEKTIKKWFKNYHGKVLGIFEKGHIGNITLKPATVVGIMIFKRHQRKGYGLKALNMLKGDLIAGIDPTNIASRKLFAKAGFKRKELWRKNEKAIELLMKGAMTYKDVGGNKND